ncbi:hypothetical protein [Escherichia coli IS1]|nr:hypothetical protein [Escherichia coli IS1]
MCGKGAGLRTHVLIGMGSALFMIVSKYGFADVLSLTEYLRLAFCFSSPSSATR